MHVPNLSTYLHYPLKKITVFARYVNFFHKILTALLHIENNKSAKMDPFQSRILDQIFSQREIYYFVTLLRPVHTYQFASCISILCGTNPKIYFRFALRFAQLGCFHLHQNNTTGLTCVIASTPRARWFLFLVNTRNTHNRIGIGSCCRKEQIECQHNRYIIH